MADAIWQWDDLVAAADGKAGCAPGRAITGFSIDTRSLAPGEVFIALKDVRDGHDFVGNAFKAGAAAAIVSQSYSRKPGDGALIRVDDTLRALERIGIAARARLAPNARVIAVTGSAGKTTTKEMLRACLSAVAPGRVHAADKSFNNHWGVPLTLARMPADTAYAVIEIGMNHAGEITPLTKMVRPHVAIVTNVLPVHVGNFPDGEVGICKAKAEIFAGLDPGGVAILNASNETHGARLAAKARQVAASVLTFGTAVRADAKFDARLLDARNRSEGARTDSVITVRLHEGAPTEQDLHYTLSIPGAHIAENSLAVILCLEALGVLGPEAIASLKEAGPAAGRGTRLLLRMHDGQALLIDEAYNANPASMHFAIYVAGQQLDLPRTSGTKDFTRLVLVLGDMLELGAEAAPLHMGLQAVVESQAAKVYACGPNMKLLYDVLKPELRGAWAQTSDGIREALLAEVRAGDIIMIKGSNGSRMAPLVAALKDKFGSTKV